MQDWIAGTFTVLGTVLVLAGATLIVLKALGRLNQQANAETVRFSSPPAEGGEPERIGRRMLLRRLSPATQLIGWGIVLLVVAAFAAQLIGFTIEFYAGAAGPW
jgi:hypothetical protein